MLDISLYVTFNIVPFKNDIINYMSTFLCFISAFNTICISQVVIKTKTNDYRENIISDVMYQIQKTIYLAKAI